MKNILISFLLIAGTITSRAQTTATDFTVNDCDGISHHLFSELDSAKIIVICWVMPCAGCILPAQSAYNVVQSYASSHPGRVRFYMADDYANSTCSTIRSWAFTNNMPNSVFFSHADIDMADYGTGGMPKIVVLAGTDHQVYYNVNNTSDGPGVQAAIDSALAEVFTSVEKEEIKDEPGIYPNPSAGKINLSFSLSTEGNTTIRVYDVLGKLIHTENVRLVPGENQVELNLGNLPDGIYYIRIHSGDRFYSKKIMLDK